GVGLGDQGVRGLADVDAAGVLRVGGVGQEVVDSVHSLVLGAKVDGRGVSVEAQVFPCRGVADKNGGVDIGGQHGGFQDAGEVEPLAADPDALAGVYVVDAEELGAGGAEDGDGCLRGGGVGVMACGEGGRDQRK